jgi:hypothetical protein
VGARAHHTPNQAEYDRVMRSPSGPVARDVMRRGFKVQARAKQNLSGLGGHPKRVRTGQLRASITVELIYKRTFPASRIGTRVAYARYVHDGTGLYGPRHRMIRPVRRQVLRWAGRGGFVYSKYSRGMRPSNFLTDALPAAAG